MATDFTQSLRTLNVAGDNDTQNLKLVSYNMHGFYQGFSVVDDLYHVRVHKTESYSVTICLHKYHPGVTSIVVVVVTLLLPVISTVVLIIALIQSHNS